MAEDTDNNIVKDIERVEITPSGGETVETEDVSDDVAVDGTADSKVVTRQPTEGLVRRKEPDAPAPTTEDVSPDPDPAPVDGESPRERALRLEVQRLRGIEHGKQRNELLGGEVAPITPKKELSPDKAEILKKYKPEEISALREVFPALAEEMGFVRTAELTAQQYTEKADGVLNDFISAHPEYLPENDKGNVLWGRFKEEFGLYKQPQNPIDYKKIFNRIHTDIFGIKPAGDKGAINAAQRKVQVASHAGASSPTRQTVSTRPKQNTSGVRFDMLKGFTPEEIAEMQGGGE